MIKGLPTDAVLQVDDEEKIINATWDDGKTQLTYKLVPGKHEFSCKLGEIVAKGNQVEIEVADGEVVLATFVPHEVQPEPSPTPVPGPMKPEEIAVKWPPGVPTDADQFGPKYYKVFPGPVSWQAAQKTCVSLGGTLAVISTKEQNDFVADLAQASGTSNVWLGATDEKHEGTWTWLNGDDMSFANWGKDQPIQQRRWRALLGHDC